MNHWDRLTAVLRAEPLDRLPVALWRHWPEVDHDPLALARAVMAWQRRFDFDLTVFTAQPTCVAEHFGAPTAYRNDPYGRRRVDRHCIEDPRQWQDLRSASGSADVLIDLNAGLRRVAAALGGTVPLIQSVPSPLTTAWHLAGDKLFEHMRFAPDSVEAGLHAIAESTVAFVRAAVDSGACGIRLVVCVPASAPFTHEEHRRFGRRFDAEVVQATGAPPRWNLLEVDAHPAWLDAFVDYPVQLLTCCDQSGDANPTSVAKRFVGIVAGGIDAGGPLVDGTRSVCFDEAASAVERLGHARAMIATGGACRTDTPEGNIDALIEAVLRLAEHANEEGIAR